MAERYHSRRGGSESRALNDRRGGGERRGSESAPPPSPEPRRYRFRALEERRSKQDRRVYGRDGEVCDRRYTIQPQRWSTGASGNRFADLTPEELLLLLLKALDR